MEKQKVVRVTNICGFQFNQNNKVCTSDEKSFVQLESTVKQTTCEVRV
jgi:hypothetical protein